MRTEPVLVLLAGIAGVVDITLVALSAVGVITWDGGQTAAVVAAVAAVAGLLGAVIRASVYSPATHAADVERALAAPALSEVTISLDGSEVARGLREVALERRELDRRERKLRGVPDLPDTTA